MWKAKLNQHFAKIAFLIWNATFHSLWLSALFYLSTGTNFNSLWIENQLLFATISISLLAFIFREEWGHRLRDPGQAKNLFLLGTLQAFVLITLVTVQAYFSNHLEFLGVSSEAGANFLSSYAWVLRSILIFILCFSVNATTKSFTPHWMGLPLQLFFFWIWFNPGWTDYLLISCIYILNPSFLFSTGIMSTILILSHAIMGSSFMGMEFTGFLRFNRPEDESSLLQSPALILGLFFLFATNKIRTALNKRKENPIT
jgi:hypothetical protein